MLLKNPSHTERTFNRLFIKSYLLFCTITSLFILTFFLFSDFSANELQNIQNYLLIKLGWFYLSIFIFSVFSFLYFRFFTPKWIFSYADKKFYFDIFIFILILLSYIPFNILAYSYVFSYFNIYFIYGSYFAILLQIPSFIAGVFINIIEGSYLTSFMLLSFSVTRLISPIILFFSYPASKTNDSLY